MTKESKRHDGEEPIDATVIAAGISVACELGRVTVQAEAVVPALAQ